MIKLVSLALKTVTVAKPKGAFETVSINLPLIMPWADNSEIAAKKMRQTIIKPFIVLAGLGLNYTMLFVETVFVFGLTVKNQDKPDICF